MLGKCSIPWGYQYSLRIVGYGWLCSLIEQVFINYIDEDGLWVMLESEEPIMQNISDALNINVIPERVQNPSVNDVVSALNTDNTW